LEALGYAAPVKKGGTTYRAVAQVRG
jgi:hypothetical protein